MIAEGTYPAVVVPIVSQETGQELVCQFGYSGVKETPQVGVCFEILSGPYAGERRSWIGYLTDKATDRTLQSLRICGFKGDDIDTFNDQRPNQEVHIVIEHEEDDKGKLREKIAWVNDPARGGGLVFKNQMDAKQRRMFAAQFKSKLKSIPAVEGKKAERQPRSAAPAENGWSGNDAPDPPRGDYDRLPSGAPPASDDDIPF